MIKLNQFDSNSVDTEKYFKELLDAFKNQSNVTLGGIFNSLIVETENKLGNYFNSSCVLCSSGTTALLCSIEYAIQEAKTRNITWVISEYVYFAIYSFLISRTEKIIILESKTDEVNLNPIDLSKEEFCIFIITNHHNIKCNLTEILSSVKNENKFVIEDCCLVFDNTTYNTSDVQCYSFSNNKIIVAGEGGCVLSKNKTFLEWFKWRTFSGIKPNLDSPIFMYLGKYNVDKNVSPFKCSINIMTSCLIKNQLDRIELNLEKRRSNYDFLFKNLRFSDYQIPTPNSPLFYPLQLSKKLEKKNLEKLQISLFRNGIQNTLGVLPFYSYKNRNLLKKSVISLPVHSLLTIDDLIHIVNTVNKYSRI